MSAALMTREAEELKEQRDSLLSALILLEIEAYCVCRQHPNDDLREALQNARRVIDLVEDAS